MGFASTSSTSESIRLKVDIDPEIEAFGGAKKGQKSSILTNKFFLVDVNPDLPDFEFVSHAQRKSG